MNDIDDYDKLYFGALAPEVDALLQQGVVSHFTDPEQAEAHFRSAIALAPDALPAYRCLFKHYNRKHQFDAAYTVAQDWLGEASRQLGLPANWREWTRQCQGCQPGCHLGQALAALKALAFIQLRRGNPDESEEALECIFQLDPADGVGASVVAALLPEREAA